MMEKKSLKDKLETVLFFIFFAILAFQIPCILVSIIHSFLGQKTSSLHFSMFANSSIISLIAGCIILGNLFFFERKKLKTKLEYSDGTLKDAALWEIFWGLNYLILGIIGLWFSNTLDSEPSFLLIVILLCCWLPIARARFFFWLERYMERKYQDKQN